jgi:hypothetical protein
LWVIERSTGRLLCFSPHAIFFHQRIDGVVLMLVHHPAMQVTTNGNGSKAAACDASNSEIGQATNAFN